MRHVPDGPAMRLPSELQDLLGRIRREVVLTQARAQRCRGRSASMLEIARAVFRAVTRERRYQLTLEGALFTATTFAVGFAAMNTMVQLLYLLFALMSGLLVVSSFLATRNLRGLGLRRSVPPLAEAQKPAAVTIHATNGKRRLASASLRVTDEMDDQVAVGAVFFDQVPAKGEAAEQYDCVFPRRGIYRFGRLRVATRWPFGLIERSYVIDDRAEVLVLPATIDVTEPLNEAALDLGELDVNRRGQGAGLFNIREHGLGDGSRNIHWKVSARRGMLMVREYEAEERRRMSVAIDNRAADLMDGDLRLDFERAVVLAASVAEALVRRGWEVELLTASGRVGFGAGEAHLLRMKRTLAMLELLDAAQHRAPGAGTDPLAPVAAVSWAGAAAPAQARLVLSTAAAQGPLTDALRGATGERRAA
jgi:uncharacterized protein (DUF58 family)